MFKTKQIPNHQQKKRGAENLTGNREAKLNIIIINLSIDSLNRKKKPHTLRVEQPPYTIPALMAIFSLCLSLLLTLTSSHRLRQTKIPIHVDATFLETASAAHLDIAESLLSFGAPHNQIPEGHAPGGSYDPDMSFHQYIHVDKGNEHKVEGIGDMLAAGTAELLLSLTEHHGVQHKLREMAHTSNPHELASSFIDVSTMKKHGLSNHELSTVQAVASAMHARIFEKIKRSTSKKGNKQKASSKCPLQTELEDGGNSLIADAVSSDKSATAKYTTEVSKPDNFDSSAQENKSNDKLEQWQDLQILTSAYDTETAVQKALTAYGDTETVKYRKLTLLFGRSTKEEAKVVIDTIVDNMNCEIGTDQQNDLFVIKLEEAAAAAGVVSIVGETLAEKVAAKQKLNENPTGVKEGAKAVKLMVNAFESLLKIAQDKIQEIIKEDPNIQQMYLDELKAAAKARADTNDVAPDIESDKKDGIVTDGRKPGLGQQIKDMFKNEWNYLKKQSGPILKLLTRIKISVGWTLPITLGGIVNPSLPGIGLVCAPLAPCLTELASAGSAILKALWTILTLPLKILWICIRTILEKVGGKIMKMLSRFSKQKEEIPEAAKEEIAKEEKDAGDSDEDLEEEPEDTGFGKSPIKTETTLVPISESKGYAMSVCKLCNLRITFGFALSLADCLLGFGLSAFKIVLSTVPLNGATLIKCSGTCIKMAIAALKPKSAKSKLEKAYWQDTCTPHSVGMCLLNARAVQCRSTWKMDPITAKLSNNPLSKLMSAKHVVNTNKIGIAAVDICSTIPKSVTVSVARSRSGRLVCPADAAEVDLEFNKWKTGSVGMPRPDPCNTKQFNQEEEACGNSGCSNRVFDKGQCATFTLKKGCELVRKKMINLEKEVMKTCGKETAWGDPSQFTNTDVPEVDILFNQCMDLMGCELPSSVGGEHGAGGLGDKTSGVVGAGRRMNPTTVMEMIEKHMDSMDYMSDHPNGALKTPKEATALLFKDLQNAMDADQLFTEEQAVEASVCVHDWKLGINSMWRHPLWAGRCVIWEREPADPKKYDIINELLKFTIDPNVEETAALNKDYFKSKQAKVANDHTQKVTKEDSYMKKVTIKIAQEDKTDEEDLCHKNIHGECTFLSSMGMPPVPMRQGQVVNRGLLLADAFGVGRTNAMWCSCECCTASEGSSLNQEQLQEGDVCVLQTIGRKTINNKEQCDTGFCNLRFGRRCPSKTDIKFKMGMSTATVNDYSKASQTCQEIFKNTLTTEKHLEKRSRYWLSKHSNQRLLQQSCFLDVTKSDMSQSIQNLVTDRPGFQQGKDRLKITILDGSTLNQTPKPDKVLHRTLFMEMKEDWNELRCSGCCNNVGKHNGKSNYVEKDNKKHSCGDGKTYRLQSRKASDSKCTENCNIPPPPDDVSEIKEGEDKHIVDSIHLKGRVDASNKKTPEKLSIRLCARNNHFLPKFRLGNTVYVAFPSSISIVGSMTNAFKVTRFPYLALHKKSQRQRECMELESAKAFNKKTWSPAQSQMIKAAKSQSWRVPYAYSPEELANSDSPPSSLSMPIDVDCFDVASGKIKPVHDDKGTQGLYCNCDSTGKVIRTAEDCDGGSIPLHLQPVKPTLDDTDRAATCSWNEQNKYCRTKLRYRKNIKALWRGIPKNVRTNGLIGAATAFGAKGLTSQSWRDQSNILPKSPEQQETENTEQE